MPRSAQDERTVRRARVLPLLTAFLLALGWVVLGAPVAVADGPTTFSNTTSIAVPATGSANQMGPASPYPSNISVSGMTGTVTKVTVIFHNLTHPTLNDIDAMVVAPNGANLVVLSDASDDNTFTKADNATLTFDDAAASGIPGAGNVPTGTYRPTNRGIGADSFPAPAPNPSNQTTLAGAFTGLSTANGTWSLFAVDDTSGDVGVMAGGWSLTITTEATTASTSTTVTSSDTTSTTGDPVTFTAKVVAGATPVTTGTVQFAADGTDFGSPAALNGSGVATISASTLAEGTHLIRATYSGATGFLASNGSVSQRVDNATVVTDTTYCNTGKVTIPDRGTATPYPSNIFVSGLAGQVTKVTATLKGLTHSASIDLDVLLSGPTPTKNLILLSDAGGNNNPVSNANVTFDDSAAGSVPSPIVSGTYRPTDLDVDNAADTFPAPAPTLSGATTLSTFNGASANGTWSLWVVDDASADAGQIANGWCVTITSQVPTTTAVTSTPNPSTFGQSVTVGATVTAGGSPVTQGTVQFTDGGTALGGPVPVGNNGKATFDTADLTVGTHPIAAAYTGAGNLADSSATTSQVVNKATTTTTLSSSKNPSDVGDAVTFTATVDAAGAPMIAGSVTFTVDGSDQPAVAVDSTGTATLTTSALVAGSHAITATYGGTASYATSHDDLDQVVAKIVTATTLTSSLNPSVSGDSVTFTATVTSGAAPVAVGGVEFLDGSTALGVVSVAADGTASFTTTALTVGSHTIHANYAGTASLAASDDDLVQAVGQEASTTVVTGSPNPSTFGADATFTATVTGAGQPAPGGAVQFSEGGTNFGPAIPVAADGTASLTADNLGVGTHTIVATYSGTSEIAGSTGGVDQVVNQAASSTSVTSTPNPSIFGGPVTFTATVTASAGGAPIADGTVEFREGDIVLCEPVVVGTDGTATCDVSELGAGTHTITAAFSGTTAYAVSSGTVSQLVNQAGTTTTVATSGSPSALGSPVTFTATVTSGGDPVAAGSVAFSVDGTVVTAAATVDSNGMATFETASLTAGAHTIAAQFSGTADYLAGDPATVDQTVELTADAGGPYEIAEGQGVTLDSSGSSAGATTYAWDLDYDGTTFVPDVLGTSPVLSWADLESFGIDDGGSVPTTYPVRLQVTSGGVTEEADASIVVSNTAPASVLTGALTATVGTPFTIKVGADDPSSADLAADFSYTVDWGDGSPVETVIGPADPPVSHTYTTAGSFDAAFTATDKDGGQGDPTSVTVTATAADESTSPTSTPTSTSTSDNGNGNGNGGSDNGNGNGGSDNDSLASTGSSVGPAQIALGGGLLIAGAGMLLLARRRRTVHGSHE